jgi:esterase/lipase superfamily enzyme
MKKEIHSWKSSNLEKEIQLAIYGHYGYALVLFPALSDGYMEYENKGLIEAITPIIKKGKFKVFSVSGFLQDSWLHESKTDEEKSNIHLLYNNFIEEELIPFIFNNCGGPIPIFTCGVSHGAYIASNAYFRRPDIFFGTIAMSGYFNILELSGNFFDSNCYFNSPVHYLPNLTEPYWLSFLTGKHHVYLISGRGENEYPDKTIHLGQILTNMGIQHQVDIWGEEFGHNWESWNKMLPHFLETKF